MTKLGGIGGRDGSGPGRSEAKSSLLLLLVGNDEVEEVEEVASRPLYVAGAGEKKRRGRIPQCVREEFKGASVIIEQQEEIRI